MKLRTSLPASLASPVTATSSPAPRRRSCPGSPEPAPALAAARSAPSSLPRPAVAIAAAAVATSSAPSEPSAAAVRRHASPPPPPCRWLGAVVLLLGSAVLLGGLSVARPQHPAASAAAARGPALDAAPPRPSSASFSPAQGWKRPSLHAVTSAVTSAVLKRTARASASASAASAASAASNHDDDAPRPRPRPLRLGDLGRPFSALLNGSRPLAIALKRHAPGLTVAAAATLLLPTLQPTLATIAARAPAAPWGAKLASQAAAVVQRRRQAQRLLAGARKCAAAAAGGRAAAKGVKRLRRLRGGAMVPMTTSGRVSLSEPLSLSTLLLGLLAGLAW